MRILNAPQHKMLRCINFVLLSTHYSAKKGLLCHFIPHNWHFVVKLQLERTEICCAATFFLRQLSAQT